MRIQTLSLLFLLLVCNLANLTAQSVVASQPEKARQAQIATEILNKSIQYHDPNNQWPTFKAELRFEQLRPKQIEQGTRTIWLDRANQNFKFIQETEGETITREVKGEECNNQYQNTKSVTEEYKTKLRLTCERAKMYRDYYSYLYGLPMKLKDAGTIIDDEIKEVFFEGKQCYAIRVTYEPSVGEDIWYFYFRTDNYALVGYRFYHDESKNDGEYITLHGEEMIDGIRIPKNRYWYYNDDRGFLAADLLLPERKNDEASKNVLTSVDYERAVSLRWRSIENKDVFNLNIRPHWLPDQSGFWYEHWGPAGKAYKKMLFDGMKVSSLFGLQDLAKAYKNLKNESLDIKDFVLEGLEYVSADTLNLSIKGQRYQYSLPQQILKPLEAFAERNPLEARSPDGKWIAFRKDYNLYIRDANSQQEFALSKDGNEHYQYASYYGWFDKMEGEGKLRPERFNVSWSPDSKYLRCNIVDTRTADKMYLLDWSVDTLYRPQLVSYYRGSPGDTTMVHYIPKFYEVNSKREIPVTLPRNTHINAISFIWSNESGQLYSNTPERGYKQNTFQLIDLAKAEIKTLFKETSTTNVDNFDYQIIGGQNKIVFASERSGWRQLYSYDLNNKTITQITKGEYFIHDMTYIDQGSGRIYFTASGKESGNNIYHRQFYAIEMDGSDLVNLTPETAHHDIYFQRNGKYFVDNYSSASIPTRTVLRSVSDGKILFEISKADVSGLLDKGYRPPQVFEVTAQDGKTKIYGALWKPTHFDPSKKYPVIDHSYTGPHTQMFPSSYLTTVRRSNQALAELGFIVMMVDGMGTYGRSKAFHDVSYLNMGMNLKDHVLAIEQLGKRHDWFDANRVGIFGHSAGGYDAGHAVLQFPETYKVAVASSADHDFRMEKAWWPEMYMGWPVDEKYNEVSNITMASNLKGKLLLVHGGLDDNVNPSATFKLAEALVDADKEFDLLILPSQRHGYSDPQHSKYFNKKRWNYFVEHLLGVEPVWDFDWHE